MPTITTPKSAEPEPLVSTFHLYPVIQRFQRQGYQPRQILVLLQLNDLGKTLSELPAVIPVRRFVDVCQLAISASDDPLFCLRAGAEQSSSDFSHLSQLAFNSGSIEQALTLYTEYLAVFNQAFPSDLNFRDDVIDMPVSNKYFSAAEAAPIMELRATAYLRILRVMTGDPQPDFVKQVYFQHSPSADPAEYEAILKAPVVFEQAASGCLLHKWVLDLPVISQNPDRLRNAIEDILKQKNVLEDHSDDLLLKVKSAIRKGLEQGHLSQTQVAEALGLSVSTLKRRLASVNSKFQEVIDEVRDTEIKQLLRTSNLSIEQVAARGGYSSVTALNQSFRRLNEMSPSEYRQTHSDKNS